MKQVTEAYITAFFERHTDLKFLQVQVESTVEILANAFQKGNKLLLCGNGGSCADCEHIAGELLKGFLLKRPVKQELIGELAKHYGGQGKAIGEKLQQGLPAISLGAHSAAISAFANDGNASIVCLPQTHDFGTATYQINTIGLCVIGCNNCFNFFYLHMALHFPLH